MASPKQLKANRENAKRSTGPKSSSGKTSSRQNALKHGLSARIFVLPHEDKTSSEKLVAALKSEFSPQSRIATELVEDLAGYLWKLRRGAQYEASLIEARAETVTIEETETSEEQLERFRRNFGIQMEERLETRLAQLEGRDPVTTTSGLAKPKEPEIAPLNRRIGAALTSDPQLVSALLSLVRCEATALNGLDRVCRLLTVLIGSQKPVDRDAKDAPSPRVEDLRVVGEESASELTALRRQLYSEYRPRTALQQEVLDYAADLLWRRKRIVFLESTALEALLPGENRPRPQKSKEEIESEKEDCRIINEIHRQYGTEPWTPEDLPQNRLVNRPPQPPKLALGKALLRDCENVDTIEKLSRYDAALLKLLMRALQLLFVLQAGPEESGQISRSE